MIEFFSVGCNSADTIVDVAAVEFRFGAVVLITKLVFNISYKKIGIAIVGPIPTSFPGSTPLSRWWSGEMYLPKIIWSLPFLLVWPGRESVKEGY